MMTYIPLALTAVPPAARPSGRESVWGLPTFGASSVVT